MLDIDVDLNSVLFACETLKCVVKVTNSSEKIEIIAWCSAHVHCLCVSSQSKLDIFEDASTKKNIPSSQPNSFSPFRGEKGECMYESEAVVLCCDLTLAPGETKAFDYSTSLPLHAPPSYKGENIAYFHKLAIGFQTVGGNVGELIRVPIRVLPINDQVANACRRESALYVARTHGHNETAIGRQSLSEASIELDMSDVITAETVKSMRSSPEAVYKSELNDSTSAVTIEMQYDDLETPDVTPITPVEEVLPSTPLKELTPLKDMTPIKEDQSGDEVKVASPPNLFTPISIANRTSTPTSHTSSRSSHLLTARDSVTHVRNPFLTHESTSSVFSRVRILHAITSLSRRRKPSVFKINKSDKNVAMFYLSKPVFRIGEDVVGWLDFSSATARCYQVSVKLEIQENIKSQYWKQPEKKIISRFTTAHMKEFCKDVHTVPILLPVPVTSSPQFSTAHVNVTWRIVFEFQMATQPTEFVSTQPKGTTDKANSIVSTLMVEELKWGLPIQVLPTNPVNLPPSQGSGSKPLRS